MLAWKNGTALSWPAGSDHAQEDFKGHGRIEQRRLLAQRVTPRQVTWPGARQIFLLRRQRQVGTQPATEEYVCGITSLPPRRASAAQLLEMVRGHWGIENRLFHVRDVTLGEDACRVRTGPAPQLLAALRNLALGLLPPTWTSKASALRRYAAHYAEALALLTGPAG
jgi:hypothetical protein